MRAVLYANNAGNPGALLGVSNQVSIAAGKPWAWVDFQFPQAVNVAAGNVWMGYIAGPKRDLTQLRYASLAGGLRYNIEHGWLWRRAVQSIRLAGHVGNALLAIRDVYAGWLAFASATTATASAATATTATATAATATTTATTATTATATATRCWAGELVGRHERRVVRS